MCQSKDNGKILHGFRYSTGGKGTCSFLCITLWAVLLVFLYSGEELSATLEDLRPATDYHVRYSFPVTQYLLGFSLDFLRICGGMVEKKTNIKSKINYLWVQFPARQCNYYCVNPL